MLLGLSAIGLFASIYHPVGIAMVVAGREQVGFVLGVNGVFGNLGIAFAAVIAGALTDWVDWRAAFLVPGLVAIATGFAYLAFDRSPAPLANPAAKSLNKAQLRALPWRLIGLIAMITLIGGVVFHASTVSLPKLFEGRLTAQGAGLTEIGTLVTVVCAVASLSQLVVGRLIDRYPLRTVLFACVALQAPLLAAVGLADGYAVPALSFLMMVVIFGEIPVNDALVARYAHDSWRSRVYAMKYLMSLGVASLAVPLVAWSYAATGGFASLYVLLAVLAAAISLLVLALPRQAQPAAPALATA
jgi:MFS family permease